MFNQLRSLFILGLKRRFSEAILKMECNILPPVSAMDDITIYSLVAINACTAVLTIVTNYCFIVGIITSPSLHTPTNIFIVSLSVSDFLVGLIVQPLACVLMIMNMSGKPICLLEYLVFISLSIFCGSSGLCVPVISLDRYIRMKKLQYYMKYVNKKRASLAVGCIWVNALVLAFTPFYGIPQDIFYIMLMVYLLGCSVVMVMAYKSVVQRSVVFSSKQSKPQKEYEVVYTRKTGTEEDDQSDGGHFDRDFAQRPSKLNPYISFTGPNYPMTTAMSFTGDGDINQVDQKGCDPNLEQSQTTYTSPLESKINPEERKHFGSIEKMNPEERKRLGSIENSRQMRITVTVCLLVAVIIISWMPTFVFSFVWALDKKTMNSNEIIVTLHYVALTFGFSCSCVNPLLYCSRIREVRKSAIDVFWKTLKCV